MSDPFAALIPEARAFLRDLAAQNTRDWFGAHKSRYEAKLKAPALLLLDQVAQERGPGAPLTSKLFRPHRDVRFSKDKTPYHTHLHMMWTLPGNAGFAPALFFGIAPDYVTAGGGVMAFDKPGLMAWRTGVDGAFGARLTGLLEQAARNGLTPDAPVLKRVPAPYGTDHPRADLLRRKGLALWRPFQDAEIAHPLATLARVFDDLTPVLDALRAEL